MSGMSRHKMIDSTEYLKKFEFLLTNQLKYITEKYQRLAQILLTVKKNNNKKSLSLLKKCHMYNKKIMNPMSRDKHKILTVHLFVI